MTIMHDWPLEADELWRILLRDPAWTLESQVASRSYTDQNETVFAHATGTLGGAFERLVFDSTHFVAFDQALREYGGILPHHFDPAWQFSLDGSGGLLYQRGDESPIDERILFVLVTPAEPA